MTGAAEEGPGAGQSEELGDLLGTRHGWFGVPDVARVHVRRERLLDELDRGAGPLVLVSAPAGSGKTTLVADWVASRAGERVAWLTLDDSETGVWPGLVDALVRLGVPLSTTCPPSGACALDPGVRHRIAATLAAEDSPVTVVLDGCLLDSAAVAADVDFLLRHSGHRLRLVLLTRADPVLPLYRYRLEDAMAEVRLADLAFTDEEAAQLLRGMGLSLSPDSVHLLNEKTRGWVTGLRFAAKLLRHRPDPGSAVEEVAGHTGNIAEYLVGEVLAAHPPRLRRVLMATSIPDTVRPGLAEALAGRGAARALAALSRGNAFIEQVPEHPGYYRYHPLFRELLRAELEYADPEAMETLQRRAAAWFADEGMLAPAVHHYVSAGAWRESAQLVVDRLAVGRLLLEDRDHPLVAALRRLPEGLDDPAAHLVRATLALGDGDTDGVDRALEAAGRADGGGRPTGPVLLTTAVLRMVRARFDAAGEAGRLADLAERALRSVGDGSASEVRPELVALVLAGKGVAATRLGRLEEARAAFEGGAAAALRASSQRLVVECLGHLALLACCGGDFGRAEAFALRALAAAEDAGIRPADRPAAPYVARAWVAVEQHDLRVAAEQARSAEHADVLLGDPVPRCLMVLVTSRLREAQGDRAGALARVRETAGGLTDEHRWLVDRLRVEEARLLVAGREPEAALAVVTGSGRTGAAAEAALVAVQAHLRRGDEAGAEAAMVDVLGRQAPPAVRVSGWLAECARQLGRGATPQARRALARGLDLAAVARLRRPLHEAPAPVRHLFLHDARLTAQHPWVFEVGGLGPPTPPSPRRPTPGSARRPSGSVTVESLTRKEREVLGYLAELLTTEEIAAAMYVSVNTVRTHVRNILRKLGVNSRNGAVRAARERELLPGR